MDKATFVLFGIFYGQLETESISITDIDVLVNMATEFDKWHANTDWEQQDWTDTVANYYNSNKPSNWKAIDMSEPDPMAAVKEKMGQYLSEDESDYDDIIISLKEALVSQPDSLIDYVEYNKNDGDTYSLQTISVWEKVELEFTVREFCKLVGITI